MTGLRVGHHTAVGNGFLTGTTVVLAPETGMTAGVDVRGGGPATHETDLLDPTASVQRIHAIVLSGGSAYGLATCTAVMVELAADGVGLRVGPAAAAVVPLVPGAALFDLGRGGDFTARPTADFGVAAVADARRAGDRAVVEGSVGAGTGAVISNLKGGIGSASMVTRSGFTVAALVAVNAAGSPIDPMTGELLGAKLLRPADGPPPVHPDDAGRDALLAVTAPRGTGFTFAGTADGGSITNTTLAIVATDAALTKAECTKMAQVAQDGIARAINPVHTMLDGDTVFGAATGRAGPPDPAAIFEITAAAADVVSRAIVRAVLAARTTSTAVDRWPSWSDVAAGNRSG